jgi:FkbM family methyltransferase
VPTAVVQGHRILLHDFAVDRYISPSLARAGVFEPFETELLLNEVRPGDTVLDVGAHIGYYTLLFARRVGPTGRVFAFEPDPANFALLRQNVALNGYHNVVLCPLAVSDRPGPARLFHSPDNAGDHRLHDPTGGRPAVEVQAVRLDRYFERYAGTIDVIKMDIQGSEGAALEGMRALVRRHRCLKLVTEYWPQALREAGGSAARYLQLLQELGFRPYLIDERHRALVRAEPAHLLAAYPADSDRFANLLCVKSGDPPADLAPDGTRRAWPDAEERARWQQAGDLRAAEYRDSSQNGEDGILAEIFRRVGAPARYAVEIGAGDGQENNTARLLREEGWQALLLEADEQAHARLAERYRGHAGVRAVRACVTSANIEGLLEAHDVPTEFDLLSIDRDGNDYWIWAAVRRWWPRVVVIEYNASHPPPQLWVMKEDPEHAWDGTDYFGASLASLVALGRRKGYALVGTNSTGVNAFFVRSDLAVPGRFLDAELHYHYSPPRYGPHRGGWPPGKGEFLEI